MASKKWLDEKKEMWADELDGILWSQRTTPRSETKWMPFSLSHWMEALAPSEVGSSMLRRTMLTQNADFNNKMFLSEQDFLVEQCDQALL